MADILLVHPPIYKTTRFGDQDPKEPLGILYLAAVLRKNGYSVDIMDADMFGLSANQTAEIIKMKKFKILGFSVTQRALPTIKTIVNLVTNKDKNFHLCFGGITPTLSPRSLFDAIDQLDSIVLGAGEDTLLELVERIFEKKTLAKIKGLAYRKKNGLLYFNKPREKISNLDSIPFPARDLLLHSMKRIGYACFFSSRGCYGSCTFCSQNSFNRINVGSCWRGRSPENVVDELEYLNKTFGVSVIKFQDDELFGPGQAGIDRVIGISDLIIKRGLKLHLMALCRADDIREDVVIKMKKAGFERLLVGMETLDDYTLKKFNKQVSSGQIKEAIRKLKKLEISVFPAAILFNPYSTLDSILKDIEFLEKIKSYGTDIHKALKVHDGASLQKMLENEKKIIHNNVMDGYHDYYVDKDVAKAYMAIKIIFVEWIDIINKNRHWVINGIKNKKSLAGREEYEKLLKKLTDIYANFTKESIIWIKNGEINEEKIKGETYKIRERVDKYLGFLDSKIKFFDKLRVPDSKYRYFTFNEEDKFFVMDIGSSKIKEISEVDYDILQHFDYLEDNNIIKILSSKYKKSKIVESINKIKKIEDDGFFYNFCKTDKLKLISADTMSRKIYKILTNNNPKNILKEEYRWHND
ncbi:hypothetical protein A2533_02750 [Candidatus Falkowbacteria bacterium RIFOXYD2_FULL_35_9]|nr:MAG: hypothetical protein A2533_02750 [Candidatus Falkowbacteria bacterium RIFOXYD2_FULL_35_9]